MADERNDKTGEEAREQRRYEPPAILETAEFETLAVTCGKVEPDTAACIASPEGS
jgi:hypothetical protein